MGYKLLGFVTWKLAKRELRKRLPSRRALMVGGAVALGAGALAVALRHADE